MAPDRAKISLDTPCPGCGRLMLPPGVAKRPFEYDHAQGCPHDPANYPANNGDELEELTRHATEQAEKFSNYSSMHSVTYTELADCYVTIMRLAAYVKQMRGAI